jgi:hypothetical protein
VMTRPFASLRVTGAGSGVRDNAVMLSEAKHLKADRGRPFAAAQGDTGDNTVMLSEAKHLYAKRERDPSLRSGRHGRSEWVTVEGLVMHMNKIIGPYCWLSFSSANHNASSLE